MKKIALLMVLILVLIPLSCLAASGVDGSTGYGGGSASSGSGGGGGGGSKGRFLTSFSATAELDESAGKIYVSVNLGQAVDSTGFASLYRGNTMVCVQKFNLNAESAEIEFDFDGTYDDFNGEYAIRLFAFDSNLKPIAARCDVQLTDNSTVTINSADIDFDRSELSRLYYYDADNKSRSVKLASTFDFVYNGGEAEKLTADKLFDILGIGKDNTGDIELTLYNADVKCDLIVATEYDYDEIASANELEPGDWRIYFKSGASVTLCYSDAETAISLENTAGKLVLPSELSAGDVVAYYTNGTIRNFTYMKMVKITDCAVEGMVTAINASDNLIWVDDVEYKLSPALDKGFLLGEKYRFYLGMTGKISYSVAAQPEYAYILDAASTSGVFDKTWTLRILTAYDGVKEYNLASNASKIFDNEYKENLGIRGERALFNDQNFNKGNEYRLITYELNEGGEIKTLAKADGTIRALRDGCEYKANTQRIDAATLEDDVVIFNIDAATSDATFAADIGYLVDEGLYGGYLFKNSSGEYVAMIITQDPGALQDDCGFSVITGKRSEIQNGEEVTVIDYLRDEVRGTAVFGDYSDVIPNTENILPDELNIGDVIMFTKRFGDYIQRYAVLAQIDDNGILTPYTRTLKAFSVKNEFMFGYIYNEKPNVKNQGENLEIVAGSKNPFDIFLFFDKTNMYTYAKGRVIAGDILGGNNTDYFDGNNGAATMIFVRIIDDDVVDVYTFDQRVTVSEDGKASLNTKAIPTIYTHYRDVLSY